LPNTRTSPTMDALSRLLRHNDAPLAVEFAFLAVIADAIEKLEPGRMVRRHLREPLLHLQPDAHGIDADRFAGDAGDEDIGAPLVLNQGSKQSRNLQPPFVVDTCRGAPPQALLVHFGPLKSTRIVEPLRFRCQRPNHSQICIWCRFRPNFALGFDRRLLRVGVRLRVVRESGVATRLVRAPEYRRELFRTPTRVTE